MTKEQKKLDNLKSLVKDAYKKVNENHGYYVVDVSDLIEEMACELDLDVTFDDKEIKELKNLEFTLPKLDNNQTATKKYKGVLVTVNKEGFDWYCLTFSKGKDESSVDIYGFDELRGKNFKNFFNDFINNA